MPFGEAGVRLPISERLRYRIQNEAKTKQTCLAKTASVCGAVLGIAVIILGVNVGLFVALGIRLDCKGLFPSEIKSIVGECRSKARESLKVGVFEFSKKDVVRNPLVGFILDLYDD